MLSIHNLSKNFGIQPVLQNINFNISAGERIGLIGPNGSGKTTLMRILAKFEHPDSGDVSSTRPNLRIGYLAQGMDLDPRQTLHAALGLDPETQTDPAAEIESLALALSQTPNDAALQSQYDEVLKKLSTFQIQPETILAPLGLDHLPADTPIAHLSGGQKTRLMLARVLLEDPHLLLLDEPTNHLDIEMLEWLEKHLQQYPGTVIAVTHDRYFLDNVAGWILELDRGYGIPWKGNYSSWLEQKQQRLAQEEKSASQRQKTLQRELEWLHMSPKARQAKSKSRINAYNDLVAQEKERASE